MEKYLKCKKLNICSPFIIYWGTHNNLKLDKDNEIEFCQEYRYLGAIFYTSGTDDKEIKSRVIQARKCIACLKGILWNKDIRKERKLNIYNALIKSSLLCGSETWRLTENNKRWVEATKMDALRRSSRTGVGYLLVVLCRSNVAKSLSVPIHPSTPYFYIQQTIETR